MAPFLPHQYSGGGTRVVGSLMKPPSSFRVCVCGGGGRVQTASFVKYALIRPPLPPNAILGGRRPQAVSSLIYPPPPSPLRPRPPPLFLRPPLPLSPSPSPVPPPSLHPLPQQCIPTYLRLSYYKKHRGFNKTRGTFVDLECTFQPDLRRTARSPASLNRGKTADGATGEEQVYGLERMRVMYREGMQKQVSRRFLSPPGG